MKGYRDPYKVEQINKILGAADFYAYLSGDHKTSGAKTINLDGEVLELAKAYYEGKKIAVEAEDDFMNPPVSDENEITKQIVELLDHNELSAGNISEVFRALHRQDNCIGGKIWSHDDVRSQLRDNYNVDLSDDAVAIIANNIDDALDDCCDTEWMAIDEAIRTSDVKIKVTNIDWDVDKDDFDDETEYDAVNENLPKEVEIPLAELEGNVEIEDYLSDNYDHCVKSFKTKVVTV